MRTLIADAAVVLATLLAWASLMPQLLKLVRTKDPTGVSATWPAIGLVTNLAWTSYLAVRDLWAAVPSTVVMVVFYFFVLRALAGAGKDLTRPIRRGIVWAAGLTAVLVIGGWGLLGLALAWSYGVQVAPAVVAAYRTWAPTGVSVGTWRLITLEATLWGLYGWLLADGPIVVYAVVGVTAGLAILGRLGFTRNRLLVETP